MNRDKRRTTEMDDVMDDDNTEALAEVLMEHSAVSYYGVVQGPQGGAGWYCTCRAKVAGDVRWDAARLATHQAEVVLASSFVERVRAADHERQGVDDECPRWCLNRLAPQCVIHRPEVLTPDELEALDRAMRGWARDLNLDTETVPEVIARIVERVRATDSEQLSKAWRVGYAAAKNYDIALQSGERPGRPADPYRPERHAAGEQA